MSCHRPHHDEPTAEADRRCIAQSPRRPVRQGHWPSRRDHLISEETWKSQDEIPLPVPFQDEEPSMVDSQSSSQLHRCLTSAPLLVPDPKSGRSVMPRINYKVQQYEQFDRWANSGGSHETRWAADQYSMLPTCRSVEPASLMSTTSSLGMATTKPLAHKYSQLIRVKGNEDMYLRAALVPSIPVRR